MDKKKVTKAAYRKSLYHFVWKAFQTLYPGKEFMQANHIKLMCHVLTQMLENPGRKELITLPPRYCKSFVVSICFVAWVMGKNPGTKILVASYGDALANEHAEAFKMLVNSEWYKDLFPKFELKCKRLANLTTTSGGYRKAISVNGAVTGFGADIIIVDDIIKAADARSEVEREKAKNYLNEGLFSRLDSKKKGHVVAIQQRFHEDDPAAYMADKGFNLLCLRAIAEDDEEWDIGYDEPWIRKRNEPLFPQLEDLKTLKETKALLTASVFSAQYQQNPVNAGGNQISWQAVGFYNNPYRRADYLKIIQSWDTACTNEPTSDYSACVTMGYHVSGQWHVLDVHRGRYDFNTLEAKAIQMVDKWGPHCVLIEKANSGYALWDRIHRTFKPNRPSLKQLRVIGMTPRLGKEERVFINQGWLEQKKALLPKKTPWLADLRHELVAFPAGRHDDQIDALFQIFEFLEMPTGRGFMNRNPETGRSYGSRRPRRRAA